MSTFPEELMDMKADARVLLNRIGSRSVRSPLGSNSGRRICGRGSWRIQGTATLSVGPEALEIFKIFCGTPPGKPVVNPVIVTGIGAPGPTKLVLNCVAN